MWQWVSSTLGKLRTDRVITVQSRKRNSHSSHDYNGINGCLTHSKLTEPSFPIGSRGMDTIVTGKSKTKQNKETMEELNTPTSALDVRDILQCYIVCRVILNTWWMQCFCIHCNVNSREPTKTIIAPAPSCEFHPLPNHQTLKHKLIALRVVSTRFVDTDDTC